VGMNLKKNVFVVLVLSLLMSCNQPNNKQGLQSGDILFRGQQANGLSQAIDAVTQTEQAHHYTHMGIVELENDTVWVIHAAPEKGVCKETLAQFCLPAQDSALVGHYRIKNLPSTLLTSAISMANAKLNAPYNYTYIIEDEGYYCSEFVYELFVQDSIFQLEPMTFIDPASGEFHPGWIKHYNGLEIDIPEGQLGCNPNGMAASDKLKFIAYINN